MKLHPTLPMKIALVAILNVSLLALVLLVVGFKMLLAEWLKLTLGKHFNLVLLAVVLAILAIGVLASLRSTRRCWS